jgi:large subunit ribosomal protein L17
MRHRKAGRALSRTKEHRQAMMRNLVTSLLEHERLETTQAKAKELRQLAEKIITLAKKNDLHARRQALAVVRSKAVVAKLFGDLRERFLDRPGGYCRIIPKGWRLGDAAPVSVIELLGRPEKIKKAKKAKAAA